VLRGGRARLSQLMNEIERAGDRFEGLIDSGVTLRLLLKE
jgi:hypothetical protein